MGDVMKRVEEMKVGKEVEREKLKPTKVLIKDWEIKDRQGNECLVFKCKHPDKEELVEISGIKLKRYDKLKVNGIWLGTDEEGNIPFDSALAVLLRKAEVTQVRELKGKELMTDIVSFNNHLLCFKGY